MNPKHSAFASWLRRDRQFAGQNIVILAGKFLNGEIKTRRGPGLLLRGLGAAVAPRGTEGWISLLGRGLGGSFNRNAGKLRAMLRLGFIFILPHRDPGRRADAPQRRSDRFPRLHWPRRPSKVAVCE